MSRGSARSGSWLGAAAGLASVGWGANQFASLIVLYRRDLDVSATATAAMFGLYAIGLVPGLLLGGRWSDRAGRRVVVAAAVVTCAVASAVLMLGATAEAWLYVGRFIAGVGAGLGFASGAAWVAELTGPSGNGARRATIAMTAGFAGGPTIAGLVAAVAPLPEVLAYVPHLVTVAIALPLVLRTPDRRLATSDPSLPPASIRRLLRHYLAFQLPFAPWVFGSAAIALAYLPAIVTAGLGDAALAFTALLTGITPVVGILVQPLAARVGARGTRGLVAIAMAAVLIGLLIAAVAAGTASPGLALMVSVVLGAAYGLTQFTGLREVQAVADARTLGLATAVYQLLSYVGFAFPLALSGLQASAGVPAWTAVLALVGLAAVCTAWLAVSLARGTGFRARE